MTDTTSPGSQPAQPTTSDTEGLLRQFANPCEAFRQLSERRQKLVSGEALAEFEYHGNGTERRMKYNIANMEALERDIRTAQAECAAVCGVRNPNRRFALTAGSRPRCAPAARWNIRTGYY